MGRKANPATIGAFVVGAVVLAVAGVLIFGSGKLFKRTSRYVCFFSGAVDGLNVGAPVKFKGVEVGSVVDIRLRLPEQGPPPPGVTKEFRIPVTIEIDDERVAAAGGAARRDIREMIDRGFRAQLNAQSLVTGLLFVQLGFYPEIPPSFELPRDSKIAEIPTMPTTMEQVQTAAENVLRKLQEVHVEELVKSVTQAVDTIKSVVATPELKETIQALPATVANLNQTMTSMRELSVRLDAKSGPLLDSLRGTSEKGGATMDQARETLQSVQQFVEPESPLSTQLSGSLQEVSEAARALRLLANLLERNPSVLVRGKEVATQ
ncbi:MAG TPA: MlaD family protein [Steroidobacteraceae bacterium]|nr:MlaD family protein [Steroidobacteraceae bacterium]